MRLMVGGYTDPFWEALEEGQFLLQRCPNCETAYFPPAPVCPHCHSETVEWVESSGTGELYAFTCQHRTAPGVPAPVVLCIVELDEGPRLLAQVAADYEDLTLGDRVKLQARAYEDGVDRGRLSDRPFFQATLD